MASRQLGRLRQWAGEVISLKEKPTVSEEFKELERDIELRKEGIQRLILASEIYHHALSKKKDCSVLDESEKMLPLDALGVVMIHHGEEFGDDSYFGRALIKMGRAHCKIATLQEAFALTFKDTFLMSLERFKGEIKEYEALKKKLEVRRLDDQAATAKWEKLAGSKKEKDKREAEDEMDRARQRYEETAEDLRAHMHAIQENEHHQLRDLSSFLDLETNFVHSYLDVLKDIKSDWQDRPSSKLGNYSSGTSHFTTPSRKLTVKSKSKSKESKGSTISPDSSEDEPVSKHSRSGSTNTKPPSRPASRLSRKRTNSSAGSPTNEEKEKGKENDKKEDKLRRLSVAGWASSAVDSVTGSKNKKSKDKESFTTLEGDHDEEAPRRKSSDTINGAGGSINGTPGSLKKSTSFRGLARGLSRSKSKEADIFATNGSSSSTSSPAKILKPLSLQEKKVVKALYDFSGSSDELNFRAGDEIVVVQEVLDDWWMGEMEGGKQGLFPASYTEVVGARPPLPTRPGSNTSFNKTNGSVTSTPMSQFLQPPKALRNDMSQSQDSDSEHERYHHDHYLTSDADDEQIIRAVPMAANKSPVFYGGFNDAASFTDSMLTGDEQEPPITHKSSIQRQTFGRDDNEDANNWLSPAEMKAQQHASTISQLQSQQQQPSQQLQPPPQQSRRNILRTSFSASMSATSATGDIAQQPLIDRSLSDNPVASISGGGGSTGTGLSGFFGLGGSSSTSASAIATGTSTPTKKAPPPPPPRRTGSHNPSMSGPPPAIPERKLPSSSSGTGSNASNSSFLSASGGSTGSLSALENPIQQGYDRSPFESAIDLELEDQKVRNQQQTGERVGCQQFRQNPFKPQGICSNCLQFHD